MTEAWNQGYQFSIGEVWRPQEMQDLYFQQGKSKTRNSQHTKKLAVDIAFFKDGKLCDRPGVLPLGNYWEGLDTLNRWGGSWRGLVESGKSSFVDSPHFERAA